eukprot:scaffold317_cov379-Prasinococcus_capsulatus_cf.AAC.10
MLPTAAQLYRAAGPRKVRLSAARSAALRPPAGAPRPGPEELSHPLSLVAALPPSAGSRLGPVGNGTHMRALTPVHPPRVRLDWRGLGTAPYPQRKLGRLPVDVAGALGLPGSACARNEMGRPTRA